MHHMLPIMHHTIIYIYIYIYTLPCRIRARRLQPRNDRGTSFRGRLSDMRGTAAHPGRLFT